MYKSYTEDILEHKQIIGHGGGDTIAPNNTIKNLVRAVKVFGLKYIEVDPCLTKDSVFVLCHDQWKVNSKAYGNLRFPTVSKALFFAKKNNIIIELDLGHFEVTEWSISTLYNIVKRAGYIENTIWQCYNYEHLMILRNIDTHTKVNYIGIDSNVTVPSILNDFDYAIVGLNYKKIGTKRDVADKIHKMGFKAASSVINPRPTEPVKIMNDLFSQGFDFIYCDGIPYDSIKIK